MKHITVYEEIAEHAETLIERAQWRRRDQLDELDRLEKRRAEIEAQIAEAVRALERCMFDPSEQASAEKLIRFIDTAGEQTAGIRAKIEKLESKKAIRRSEYREAKQALNVIRQYDPDAYRAQAEELEELRKPAGAIRRNDQQ